MRILSRRQESIWRNKMIEIERSLLRYYEAEKDAGGAAVEVDGSFAMSAFKSGYYLRGRKSQSTKRRTKNA